MGPRRCPCIIYLADITFLFQGLSTSLERARTADAETASGSSGRAAHACFLVASHDSEETFVRVLATWAGGGAGSKHGCCRSAHDPDGYPRGAGARHRHRLLRTGLTNRQRYPRQCTCNAIMHCAIIRHLPTCPLHDVMTHDDPDDVDKGCIWCGFGGLHMCYVY